MAQTHEPTPRKPLRLWPAVAALSLWLAWLVVPFVAPSQGGTAVLSGLVFGLVVILWWLFFSRALWAERLGALVLMVAGVAAISRLVHASIANGMMGFMLPVYSFPILCLALVVWAVVSRGMATGRRRVALVGAILLACATMTLIRTNGITGNADSDLEWRWTPTPEERLLAQGGDEPHAADSPASSRDEPAARPSTSTTAATPEAAPATPTKAPRPALGPGQRHRRRLLPQPRPKPSGLVFEDPNVTASSAVCASRPTGLKRRPSRCGAAPSDRAGRPSRFAAIASSPKSSVERTKLCPPTT